MIGEFLRPWSSDLTIAMRSLMIFLTHCWRQFSSRILYSLRDDIFSLLSFTWEWMTMIYNFYKKILQKLRNEGSMKHPPCWDFYTRSLTPTVFYWSTIFDPLLLYLDHSNLFLRFHCKGLPMIPSWSEHKPYLFVYSIYFYVNGF